MAIYETVFMARAELNPQQVEELTKNFSDVITKAKGKILKTESWGLRTLAYKINKSKKAHYVLLETEVDGETIIEVERQMRLHEDIMRYMTIKLDEPTKDESAILRKDTNDSDDNHRRAA